MNVCALYRSAGALGVLALAAGCGTAGNTSMPAAIAPLQRTGGWIAPEAKRARALLYVAVPTADPSYSGAIDIFAINGLKYKLVGQIQDDDGPDGMTTDAAGNLYVTDEGVATEGPAVGDIKVYPKGSRIYSRLIVPAKWIPFDIAAGGDGTLYVANIAPIAYFSPGSVSVYPPGASQPSRTLRLRNFQVDGITLHRHTSTIYISYDSGSGNARIAEFVHARGKAIDFGVSYHYPWGILEDGSNDLLAADGTGTVNVYSEATHQLVQRISIPNAAASWLAFNQRRTHLFVSNFKQVEILSYPAGTVVGAIQQPSWNSSNYPTGLAFWPPPK